MANIQHLGFITYKITPFIIVAYLVISSLLSGSIKGFYVLAGVMISAVFVIMVDKMPFINELFKKNLTDKNAQDIYTSIKQCNMLTFEDGHLISKLPLSTSTISFIFAYFMSLIARFKVAKKNAFFILILCALVSYDLYYHFTGCTAISYLVFIPFVIGTIMGIIWGLTVNKDDVMDVKGVSSSETCSQTSKNKYTCNMKDGSEIITF